MGDYKQHWNGLEELEGGKEFNDLIEDEFTSELPIEQEFSEERMSQKSSRRDFLKMFGFGISAATLAACTKTPVKKAIPYVIKPDDITPGVPNYYAATCMETGLPTLVKTREGRPILVEGNEKSMFAGRGVSSEAHASLYELYDSSRLKKPVVNKKATDSWAALDEEVMKRLKQGNGRVRLVSGTIFSPTTHKLIHEFLDQFQDGKHIEYDSFSYSAIAKAHKNNFGKKVIPSYDFSKAEVIVSFGADFLGAWLSPEQFTHQWAKTRTPKENHGKMSRHYQFESLYSLTGGNADYRAPINGSEMGKALLNFYNHIAAAKGGATASVEAFSVANNWMKKAAQDMVKAGAGKSLIVCGSNNVYHQEIVNAINHLLGNYGSTVDHKKPFNLKRGDEAGVQKLIEEMKGGAVDALIVWNANPVYNMPNGEVFKSAMANVKSLTLAITPQMDETAEACNFIASDHTGFEKWGDAMQMDGHYSINQPTIRPIFKTRQAEDSLLVWMGRKSETYYDYLRNNWNQTLFPASGALSFEEMWTEAVRSGVYYPKGAVNTMEHDHGHDDHGDDHAHGEDAEEDPLIEVDLPEQEEVLAALGGITFSASSISGGIAKEKASGTSLVLYQSNGMKAGRYANVPMLQELPDPLTKITWDNYVSIPYQWADQKGFKEGDWVKVTVGKNSLELPVTVQPGQAADTIGIAVGYGRKAGKVASECGMNAFPLDVLKDGTFQHAAGGVKVEKLSRKRYRFAKTQTFIGYDNVGTKNDLEKKHYKALEKRFKGSIIKETTLGKYQSNPGSGNENRAHIKHHNEVYTLWSEHEKRGYHWVMAIDMNKCTGCGSCIMSCHTENNVSVVGRKEVRLRRDMHWLRIDRYYRGNPENPLATFQPMMCQHCDNAPCETVCPVLATVHSDEGLNQQVYNRCIGTRYCANNCPYKVRRFNWFSYCDNKKFSDVNKYHQDELGRLILNPDVTVRARGVMEKCSFCVQRLQAAKLEAKKNMSRVKEADLKTACQSACPSGAILFGDLNDKDSDVYRAFNDERAYHVIEEVKTLPSVGYMVKVRNNENELDMGLVEAHVAVHDTKDKKKGKDKEHKEEAH